MGTVTTILNIIRTIAEVAPVAIQGIEDMKKFVIPLYRSVTGGDAPTPEETAEIDAGIAAMGDELMAMKRPE